MKRNQGLAVFILVFLFSCNGGEKTGEEQSERNQIGLLTQAWVLESAYSNADSALAQLQPSGSRLFLEVDNSYTFLTPEGSSTTGIWKIDSSGSYLLLAPSSQPMKKCLIKTLDENRMVTYYPLDSLDKNWVEETYVKGP